LLDRGLEPLVLEAGSQVGANIAQWRHVRLFRDGKIVHAWSLEDNLGRLQQLGLA